MNKHLRIIVGTTLCLLMALSLPAQGAKEQASEQKLTPITMWYGALMTEAGPPPADWVVYDIVRDKLGIELILTALPSSEGDQDVKVQAAGAANNLPDVFMVRRTPWLRLVKQGVIADVDDMYPLMPKRTSEMYTPGSRAYTTYNGKSYGLASPGAIIKNEGVVIRKDWLDRLGLEVPKTTEEYLNVMRAFTFNDPDGNGKNDTYGFGAFLEINPREEGLGRRLDPFFGAFGVAGTWNMSKDNFGLNIRKPAYYDALAFVKQLVDERLIDPNWLSYRKDDFRAAWKQGRFGIMREQNGALAMEANYKPFDMNFPDGQWMVIDPPMGPEGKSSVGVYSVTYRITAISAKAAKEGRKEAIARLFEWMSSDEGYYLLGWGVEGVNYTFDKDGIPTAAGIPDPEMAYTQPKGRPVIQLANLIYRYTDAELKATFPTYKTANGRSQSALDVLRDFQTRAWTEDTGADTLPLPNDDLKRFYEQGVAEFITGRRALNQANWKAFVADFDRLGGKAWEDEARAYAQENGLLL